MQIKYLICACIAVILLCFGIMKLRTVDMPNRSKMPTTDSVLQFKNAMRELWAMHVIWTREFIVAAAADAPNKKDVTDRLMRNQVDIGNAVMPFYGNDAGSKLTDLLKEHISTAGEVVMAAKNKDQTKLKDADKRWHDNALAIAKFLSDANPNWPYNSLVDALNEHLKLTTQEAVAHLNQQWQQDIKMFDAVFAQIMMMADVLSDGIIKQFPQKF